MTACCELASVHRTHGSGATAVHALSGVDLTVAPGELVAVMGPSGSGKSTLLNLAGGLDRPTVRRGHRRGPGARHADPPRTWPALRRRSIGYVFQDLNLLPEPHRGGERRAAARTRRRSACARPAASPRPRSAEVGLADLADRFPDDMSGGQQQRVAIARALVGDRRLVLADEPTGALDSQTGESVLRLLRARVDAGAAGVLVTHEARHAGWADRVVFLRDGVIVDTSGPLAQPEDLLTAGGTAPMRSWLVALRIARREARRAKGRTALIVAMIACRCSRWRSRPRRTTCRS